MRHNLGLQVLIALGLGIAAGTFFGPLCSILDPIGNIYVMLLQMVALPYICFTLIHGLGSMAPDLAKRLFRKGWPFWVMLWTLIFLVIYFASLLIPKPGGAFIGNRDQDPGAQSLTKNFLSYIVPENPFYDLANNIVPAIAVFGLIVGVALMHLPKKEPLFSILERANQTIEKILKWIAILSPIGVFAHIAVASGTVYFEDLISIQFYVIAFILICLTMVFWVLPGILSSLTPLKYKEVLSAFKTICFLPFATAVPTIALPFIILYLQRLGAKHAEGDPNFHVTSQTVMPFCYSFGQIGNCLILFYVFFISFFYRQPIGGVEKAMLSALTVPLSVGSSATSINAVSFLIKQLSFPNEAVQLFTETMSVTLNFQVLLSVSSITTFIILVLYSYYDLLEVKWKQLTLHFGGIFGVLALVVGGGKALIQLNDNYQHLYLTLKISDVIKNPVDFKVFSDEDEKKGRDRSDDPLSNPLSEVLGSGILKVGYDAQNMPYCYFNENNELVGYDVAYAFQLARDLDSSIEFVPLNVYKMGEELALGYYDIGMAAIIMDEERILNMDFTHPYTEQDIVLIVPNKERALFSNLYRVQNRPGLRFGAVGGFIPTVRRHFPLGTLVTGRARLKEFKEGTIDAWVSAHTPAFAWSLSHPDFTVVDYGGLIGKTYFAYSLPLHSTDWSSFLNNWLMLKEQAGFKKRMHDYWIIGERPTNRPPRWSILRNVLHWID